MDAPPVPNIIARLNMTAALEQTLYLVPPTRTLTVQGITFCNLSAGANSFRLSVSRANGVTSAADYIYYDVPMIGHETIITQLDMVLYPTDIIRCYSTPGNVTAILFGELT